MGYKKLMLYKIMGIWISIKPLIVASVIMSFVFNTFIVFYYFPDIDTKLAIFVRLMVDILWRIGLVILTSLAVFSVPYLFKMYLATDAELNSDKFEKDSHVQLYIKKLEITASRKER